nr:MAG TPA: Histone lysine methyltransferase SET associated [Caudoviricetes sp.]
MKFGVLANESGYFVTFSHIKSFTTCYNILNFIGF